MMPVAFFPFLTLYLHPGPFPALETSWLGFAGSTDYRHSLTEAMGLAQQHQVAGWVADDRHLGAVRPKDLEWTLTHVIIPLSEAGLQRFALLESADQLNRLTIERMYGQAIPTVDFELRRFTDLTEARAWANGV